MPIPDRIETSMVRPHVVLLGAGASLATLPEGDANGRKLPLLNNLAEVAGLSATLEGQGVLWRDRNFEDIYSELHEEPARAGLITQLEDQVREYFAELTLPATPTIYDHLLLSLRSKDVVATFNWDPLLVDAFARNQHRAPLPHLLFLHGNVRVGYCLVHKHMGLSDEKCSQCLGGHPKPANEGRLKTGQ